MGRQQANDQGNDRCSDYLQIRSHRVSTPLATGSGQREHTCVHIKKCRSPLSSSLRKNDATAKVYLDIGHNIVSSGIMQREWTAVCSLSMHPRRLMEATAFSR